MFLEIITLVIRVYTEMETSEYTAMWYCIMYYVSTCRIYLSLS